MKESLEKKIKAIIYKQKTEVRDTPKALVGLIHKSLNPTPLSPDKVGKATEYPLLSPYKYSNELIMDAKDLPTQIPIEKSNEKDDKKQ
jgi:hypothetical protein